MARPQNWPPKITVHKASGQARIRVRERTYYLGKAGSPEAKREYARLLVELADQKPPEPLTPSAMLTVVEVVAKFLRDAEGRYSARGGQVTKFRTALGVLADLHGRTPVSSFGSVQLREVQAAMAGRWCANTVNRHVIRIRTAWRWLEEEDGLVPPGSWAALSVVSPLRITHPLYRPAPERAKTTDFDAVRAVCRLLPDVPRAMLLFQWWTGARTGEVVIMQAEDVEQAAEVWLYRPKKHKNDWRGQERVIAVGPKARAVLAPWLAACQEPGDFVFPPLPHRRRLRAGRAVEFPADCYDRSRPYTVWTYSQAVRRAADAAGLPSFHAYLCRAATRMRVSAAVGDEQARAVLGQKTLDTSLRYGELDQSLARDAARRLG